MVIRTAGTALLAVLVAVLPQPALAQLTGELTADGCVDVARAPVIAEGRLTLRSFPGPPNYESIAAGDAEERAFILELPASACIDDGGDFADPGERFVTVHVVALRSDLAGRLRSSVGSEVAVSGEGFAAHTGHHHAPLVLMVEEVAAR